MSLAFAWLALPLRILFPVFSVAGRLEPLFARGGFANFGEIAGERTAVTVRILDKQGLALLAGTIKAED